jgi:hypothetical protein
MIYEIKPKQGGIFMSIKAQIIQLAEQVQQEEIKFIDTLSDEEKNQIGKVDDWSVKDMLVHISVWKGIMAERLDGGDSFEGIKVDPDFENTNVEIYEKYSNASWPEVEQLVRSCHNAMAAGIERLEEADLGSTDRYPWQDDQVLWQRIYGTEIIHPALHISEKYIRRGEVEPARELIESVSEKALELSDEDAWKGAQHYNIACYQALAGEREAALEKLKTAFPLRPELVHWSQEDTDLESLWGDKEFQALIQAYEE